MPLFIKICGITRVSDAKTCVELGANAVGCVFFPKSPRHVTLDQAKTISQAVENEVETVGVFVNQDYANIMRVVDYCRLKAVQLHGQESPDLVTRLRETGIKVIKALFIDGAPSPGLASKYSPSAFLVECSQGPLPGGNAAAWDYAFVRRFTHTSPLILAGGLSAATVANAIVTANPDGVDVSSAVEIRPGIKSRSKVAAFIAAAGKALPDIPESKQTNAS